MHNHVRLGAMRCKLAHLSQACFGFDSKFLWGLTVSTPSVYHGPTMQIQQTTLFVFSAQALLSLGLLLRSARI